MRVVAWLVVPVVKVIISQGLRNPQNPLWLSLQWVFYRLTLSLPEGGEILFHNKEMYE
jgi:hypothetical protein